METKRGSGGATERAFQAAVEILTHWETERERTPVDRLVAGEFRARKYLNSSERRWVSATVYGCVRYLRRQTWLLERMGLPDDPVNRIWIWCVAPGDGLPIVCPRSVGVPATTADAIAAAVQALPGPDAMRDHLTVTLSFPDEMADALVAMLGEEAERAAAAFNAQAPTTLRVNPLRVSRDHLQRALTDSTQTHYSPWGLELPRRVNVNDLPGFRTGWFEVQEEASQLAAILAAPEPKSTVVEIGAGAGGKTLAMAALMDNVGQIVAIDTHAGRLDELKRRAERAGVTCIETIRVDADEAGWWQAGTAARRALNKVQARADLVLIDAPCTGSGVLRRSPDTKWRVVDRTKLMALQATLLAQGAMFTRPGGRLIYLTCAFEEDQNEERIAAFQETEIGQQFVVEPIAERFTAAMMRATELAKLPLALRSSRSGRVPSEADAAPPSEADTGVPAAEPPAHLLSGPYLRTWPHRHGLDAFFVACLRREAPQ